MNIVFDGILREGVTQNEAAVNMSKLSGADQERVTNLLFSGKRVILKRDLSAEKADKPRFSIYPEEILKRWRSGARS